MGWRRTGPQSVRVDTGKACRMFNIGDGLWRAGRRRCRLVTLENRHVRWDVPVERISSRGCEDTPTTPAAYRLINGGSFSLIARVVGLSAATPELNQAGGARWLAELARMRLPQP